MDWPRSATATCTCSLFMRAFLLNWLGGLGLTLGGTTGDAAVRALAAVLGEIAQEGVHGSVVGHLVQGPAVTAGCHQTGVPQGGQVEGQGRRREVEALGDGSHRHALL